MQILWLYLIVQKYRKLHMPMGTIQCFKMGEESTFLSVQALEVSPNAIEHFDLPLSAATFSAGAETP